MDDPGRNKILVNIQNDTHSFKFPFSEAPEGVSMSSAKIKESMSAHNTNNYVSEILIKTDCNNKILQAVCDLLTHMSGNSPPASISDIVDCEDLITLLVICCELRMKNGVLLVTDKLNRIDS